MNEEALRAEETWSFSTTDKPAWFPRTLLMGMGVMTEAEKQERDAEKWRRFKKFVNENS